MENLKTILWTVRMSIGTVFFVYYVARNLYNGKQPSKIGMLVVIIMLMEFEALKP